MKEYILDIYVIFVQNITLSNAILLHHERT